MTIRDLVDNFGNKFGLSIDDAEPYLDVRFINNTPLDNLMNNVEDNPFLEVDSILANLEDNIRGEPVEEPIIESQETNTGIKDSIEAVGK
jgi:hypothetical protein